MTAIEWTHQPGFRGETWNPIRAQNNATGGVGHFCEHVSEGCRNCYAEAMQKRLFNNPIRYAAQYRKQVDLFLDEATLLAPLKWKTPRCVFVGSMTDVFGEWVEDSWLDRLFAVMALCPQHRFLVLTKRAARMRTFLIARSAADAHSHPAEDVRVAMTALAATPSRRKSAPALTAIPRGQFCAQIPWPLPNVWLGVSVEDQTTADERIPLLLETPAAKRFISAEPLLGGIDMIWSHCPKHDFSSGFCVGSCPDRRRIDWIIAGGESGAKARPMHPDWVRGLRDQCVAARVPFFFKQWGEWTPASRDMLGARTRRCGVFRDGETFDGACLRQSDELPASMLRVGKRRAGADLDGRQHREFPG